MGRKFSNKEIKAGCRVVVNDKVLPLPAYRHHHRRHGSIIAYDR